jgi:hypothetical protein
VSVELVTNGMTLLMVNRGRRVQPIAGLSRSQIEWCEQNLRGFAWPRVQRLADHERAAAERRV